MNGGGHKGGTGTRLLVLLLLIVPAVFLTYIGYKQTETNYTKLIVERRGAVASLSAATLKERFDRLTDLNVSFASRIAFRDEVERGEWDAALKRVAEAPLLFPFIERAVLVSATGTLMADTLPGNTHLIGQNYATRDWYVGVSRDWKPYISEVYKRTGTPVKNVVSVSGPIRSGKDARVIGILVLQVPMDTFFDWSSTIDVGRDAYVYYVDHHAHVASHPRYELHGDIIDYSSVPAAQNALAGTPGVGATSNPLTDEWRLSAWARVPVYGWGVVVSQSLTAAFEERDEAIRSLLIRNSIYLIIILLAALTVMRLLDRLDRQYRRERAILASMGEGLAVTDTTGRITYLNPGGAKILHLKEEEVRGRLWTEVAGQPKDLSGKTVPEADRGTVRALKKGVISTVTYRYTRVDGTEFTAVATAAPVVHEGNRVGSINVFRDISSEVETERQRRELLSIASHQMRTPITAIRWIAEMLLHGEVGKISREQKKQLANLLETAKRLGGLVNDMLNVSRLEAGRLKAVPAPTDLSSLLKKAAVEVSPLADEKGQKLTVKVPARLPKLTIDAKLMSEATINLLSNAIKYTPEGGQVFLTAEARAKDVVVSVRDTGIGIPKAQQGEVFRKFFRAANAVQSGVEGTGLGLYVVKEIVEISGGTLTFVSKEGEGTTFTYTLPLPKA